MVADVASGSLQVIAVVKIPTIYSYTLNIIVTKYSQVCARLSCVKGSSNIFRLFRCHLDSLILFKVCMVYLHCCRYDAKVKATHQRMKELGLLSSEYSHCLTLDEWEIPRKNVVLNRKLGEGAFGTVCGGEMLDGDHWVAVAVKTLKIRHSMEEKVSLQCCDSSSPCCTNKCQRSFLYECILTNSNFFWIL